MMNYCCLLLVHAGPEHYKRLVDTLVSMEVTVFVHVDKKTDESAFRNDQWGERVKFVEDRVSVGWGGFSMIDATLRLMYLAMGAGQKFDYYVLLSGSDFPVKSPADLDVFFGENRGSEFLNFTRVPNLELGKSLKRFSRYYIEPKGVFAQFRPASQLLKVVNRAGLIRSPKRGLGGNEPYAGSQWWALTYECVSYILRFVDENPKFVKFFRNVKIPDESFFQTIIGNSSFGDAVHRNLTFTDWGRPQPPYPATIDPDHLQLLISQQCEIDDAYGKGKVFFARKFPNDSENIVNQIKAEVW